MTKENSGRMQQGTPNGTPARPNRNLPNVTAPGPVAQQTAEHGRTTHPFDVFVVIDHRTLERACFVQCLRQQCADAEILDYASEVEWKDAAASREGRQVILTNLGARPLTLEDVRKDLKKLVAEAKSIPVVVLGANQDLEACIAALDCGAAGYIPPCVKFDDIVEATALAVNGGVFVPRASLLALRKSTPEAVDGRATVLEQFTGRQIAVADALRCGSANKTIAYKLALRESTVKVHIRNIFQKLKATNRTEAAFLLNQMSGWPEARSTLRE